MGYVPFLAHSIAYTSSLLWEIENNHKQQLLCMMLSAWLEGAYLPCKEKCVKTEEYFISVFIKYHAQAFQIPSCFLFEDCLGNQDNKKKWSIAFQVTSFEMHPVSL